MEPNNKPIDPPIGYSIADYTNLAPGMQVAIVYGYGDRFWLRDKAAYAASGDVLTICSIAVKKVYPNLISSHTGKPVVTLAIGFNECCLDCRSNRPHHEMTGAHHMFSIVKDSKTTNTDTPNEGWVPAKKIADMILAMCKPWNPGREQYKNRIHVGNFSYEVMRPINEVCDVVAVSLAWVEHGQQYFRFKVMGETSEDREQRIPMTLARPIIMLYDNTKKHLDDLSEKMELFATTMKEIELAKQVSTDVIVGG